MYTYYIYMPLEFLIVQAAGAAAGIGSRSADARAEAAETDATRTETSGGALQLRSCFSLGGEVICLRVGEFMSVDF